METDHYYYLSGQVHLKRRHHDTVGRVINVSATCQLSLEPTQKEAITALRVIAKETTPHADEDVMGSWVACCEEWSKTRFDRWNSASYGDVVAIEDMPKL
jgi:hypothetical protein